MARVRGTDIFRVNVRGAGRVARDFDRAARHLADEINAELRSFGLEAEAIFRDHAPRDTKDLQGAIRAVPFFRALRPRVRVVVEPLSGHRGAERDGYDYLGVTRRGHRSRSISPRTTRALKVHVMGHRNPHIYVFRHSVTGARPSGDWVSRAEPQVDRLASGAERSLGRRVQTRLL